MDHEDGFAEPVSEFENYWDHALAQDLLKIADRLESGDDLDDDDREAIAKSLRSSAIVIDPVNALHSDQLETPELTSATWPEAPSNSTYNQESSYDSQGFWTWIGGIVKEILSR